jgi:hypothetical protein
VKNIVEIAIPGKGVYRFEHLVLVLNGSISWTALSKKGSRRIGIAGRLVDIVNITAEPG